MEAEWKCATMVPTTQSVMRGGPTMMQQSYVTPLDTALTTIVRFSTHILNHPWFLLYTFAKRLGYSFH